MGESVSKPRGQKDPSGIKTKRNFLLALLGASYFVFVSGSFVFAYLFAFSPPSSPGDTEFLRLPKIGIALPPAAPGPSATATRPAPGSTEAPRQRLNVLLLGIDQRDDEKGSPTRSDTMMVVSVDPVTKTAAIISFARDMWVEIPGFADNRINVANFLGDVYKKDAGSGPILAEKTIERNFGLKIDYYARINFRGFEKIVDTLGGITVDVERAIRDDEYPTEDYEVMSIYIPAGVQHMNGKVALQYARSRHSENDFGRMKRQQTVLVAIRDRGMQLDVIPKLPSLMGTLKDAVDTDMPPTEILRLATVAKDIGAGNVSSLVIDDKLARPFTGEGGADLLAPDKPAIRRAIAALLADPVVKNEAAKIEVVNGTSKAGLATRTGDYLVGQGYDVVKISTADRTDYRNSQIQLLGDKKQTANLLAGTLKLSPQAVIPPKTPAPSSGTDIAPDLRILLGQDFTAVQ